MAHQEHVATSSAVEDYAKAIYARESRGPEPVSTTALAERLGVTPASASGMVKRLGELGLVEHQPYRGVTGPMEDGGWRLEVMRHHRLLELYVVESLGVPWDRVHEEAELLDHVLSEELEELISAKLGHPTRDPHGDPIPGGPDATTIQPAQHELGRILGGGARSSSRSPCWPPACPPRASARTPGRW